MHAPQLPQHLNEMKKNALPPPSKQIVAEFEPKDSWQRRDSKTEQHRQQHCRHAIPRMSHTRGQAIVSLFLNQSVHLQRPPGQTVTPLATQLPKVIPWDRLQKVLSDQLQCQHPKKIKFVSSWRLKHAVMHFFENMQLNAMRAFQIPMQLHRSATCGQKCMDLQHPRQSLPRLLTLGETRHQRRQLQPKPQTFGEKPRQQRRRTLQCSALQLQRFCSLDSPGPDQLQSCQFQCQWKIFNDNID